MSTIAYLLYGNRREYHLELTYSVLSAIYHLRREGSNIRLLLVTDKSTRRDDLPIEYLHFSERDFYQWTEKGEYFHAAKVHALSRALDHTGGPVVLIDTDTRFDRSPSLLFERIDHNQSLMHADEGLLKDLDFWKPVLDGATAPVAGYDILPTSSMFNSGVVGVAQSAKSLLPQVTELVRGIRAIHPVFNAEQFAFASVLGRSTRLNTCPDLVWHYWGYARRFCHAQIEAISQDLPADVFTNCPETMPEIGYPPKRKWDQVRAVVRQLARGTSRNYRFAYLAYLSAFSNTNPTIANAWAATALEVLTKLGPDPRFVFEDFPLLVNDRYHLPEWLDPENIKGWREFGKQAALVPCRPA